VGVDTCPPLCSGGERRVERGLALKRTDERGLVFGVGAGGLPSLSPGRHRPATGFPGAQTVGWARGPTTGLQRLADDEATPGVISYR
jgi:hypothetical protein